MINASIFTKIFDRLFFAVILFVIVLAIISCSTAINYSLVSPPEIQTIGNSIKRFSVAQLDTSLSYKADTSIVEDLRAKREICKEIFNRVNYMAYSIKDFSVNITGPAVVGFISCTYDEAFRQWPYKTGSAEYLVTNDTSKIFDHLSAKRFLIDLLKIDPEYKESRGGNPEFEYKAGVIINVQLETN